MISSGNPVFCAWTYHARSPITVNELWLRYGREMSFDGFLGLLPSFGIRIWIDEFGSLFVYRFDVRVELLRIASLLSRVIPLRSLPISATEVFHSGITASEYIRRVRNGHI